jgi:uncharacterized protein (TIGR02246 family)
MTTPQSRDTIAQLVDARNRGDIEATLALYEDHATLVAEAGKVVSGKNALREALVNFVAMKPKFTVIGSEIVVAGDLAMHCSHWSLHGTASDGQVFQLSGRSADVLRRQEDGNWLMALDNPWGTAILD